MCKLWWSLSKNQKLNRPQEIAVLIPIIFVQSALFLETPIFSNHSLAIRPAATQAEFFRDLNQNLVNRIHVLFEVPCIAPLLSVAPSHGRVPCSIPCKIKPARPPILSFSLSNPWQTPCFQDFQHKYLSARRLTIPSLTSPWFKPFDSRQSFYVVLSQPALPAIVFRVANYLNISLVSGIPTCVKVSKRFS
jgi:hypothetical protein